MEHNLLKCRNVGSATNFKFNSYLNMQLYLQYVANYQSDAKTELLSGEV